MSATPERTTEREQAHLPDHELIRIDALILAERHSSEEQLSKSEHLSGWEGGLAPAPGVFQTRVTGINVRVD